MPIVDLCNHRENPNVRVLPEGRGTSLQAKRGIAAGEPSEAAREAAAGLASGLRAMLTEQGIDVDAALVRKPATILV